MTVKTNIVPITIIYHCLPDPGAVENRGPPKRPSPPPPKPAGGGVKDPDPIPRPAEPKKKKIQIVSRNTHSNFKVVPPNRF